MKKIVKIKDTYEVVIENCENMSDKEIKQAALDVVKVIKRKETKDSKRVKDATINNMEAYEWWNEHSKGFWDGDLILETRERADAKEYFERMQNALPHIKMKLIKDFKDGYKIVFIKEEVNDASSKGARIAKVMGEALKGECGPFGGENPKLKGNKLGLFSQMPTEWYVFNDDGSITFENLEEIIDKEPDEWGIEDEEDKAAIISECKHFASVKDLLNSNLLWFEYLDEADILSKVDAIMKEEVGDVKVEDIPVNSPEEEVNITYIEKLKGGKNALTYGMIESAFKDRGKDDGKTFAAYVDVAIESLKDDIKNAQYIVSGEMKSTRRLLLEDYIKIEHLVEKAGLEEKLAIMKPLVDELSEKLNLNYWKQPKFRKSQQKQASKELRNKHRWDSKISKTMKPVFLCSKSDLTASYNDAKNGKLPEVFEANLEKVRKDMTADYDRINQGRDTYLEDPRINQTLPEIVDLYETALKYADDLEYSDLAHEFKFMLDTIKKAWGLAGE